MKKAFSLSNYMFVLLFSCLSSAYASDMKDAQAYQLMDKSGLTRAIESLPQQMQALSQQMALTEKNAGSQQAFSSLLQQSVNTDQMLQQIATYLKSQLNAEETVALLAWLSSEPTATVIDAELQSSDPQFQQNLMRYIADLQSNPPADARKQAIINFVQSTQMVEQSVKMIMSIVDGMFDGVKATRANDPQVAATLDQQKAQMEPMLQGAMQQQMVLTSYYIYRDISDEDLAKYAQFYQTDLGKKYLSIMYGAIGTALGNWGTDFVNLMVKQDTEKQSQ
ncbi:hypothetical protein [Neptunicella marina]|uniref:DUF2059 domain-containing protein n=1 Tax=Neptunicella marina TaxID=2125989 RepID=A0A8J6IMN4_9ALTE|nr:hypothetical protein [Neptunicella marina]MBC3764995.1 hypothetical protein [Neptunicella marina]